MRDLDKDPIEEQEQQYMAMEEEEFASSMIGQIMQRVTGLHIIAGSIAILALLSMLLFGVLWGIPQYGTYLEIRNMRLAILWAETHAMVDMTVGERLKANPELNRYLLIQKIEETDLENLD